jgi:predicted RNA-binding protein associated with RNAse of E/G family
MVTLAPGAALPRFPRVHIHYRRPPDRITIYRQDLIHEDAHVKVTLARNLALPVPVQVDGEPILEGGSDVLWFTYPGAWHDVGRFHRADGRLTGLYANVLTPCVFQPGHDWETTDLFLDVWLPADGGRPQILDEDELKAAEASGVIPEAWAKRARAEVRRLVAAWDARQWPAPEVYAWTRERALASYGTP